MKKLLKNHAQLAALLFALCLSLGLQAQQQIKRTLTSDIPFLEHVPPGYSLDENAEKKYPLMIFLHGAGERGDGSDEMVMDVTRNGPPKHIKNGSTMTFEVEGQSFEFIVISPQLIYGNGNWPNSYIDEVVQFVLENYRVDLSRVYLTGLSLGGGGVWRYGGDYSAMFAAIAPICGAQSVSNTKARTMADNSLPVWAFHGDADGTQPVESTIDWIETINSFDPTPRAEMSIYAGVGHSGAWNRAYNTGYTYHEPNLYEWFLMQQREELIDESDPVPTVEITGETIVTLPENTVSLQCASCPDDDRIVSYAWSQVSGPSDATLTNAETSIMQASELIEGIYSFQLTVTDNNGATASDQISVEVIAAQEDPSDCGCDYTIPERQHITDGVELGIQPGDVICLQADLNYNALVLLNIVGTAENPIIIKNCGGKVLVDVSTTFAFKTQYSKHFRITGTGDPAYEHGIELVGGSQGLTLDYLSTNFEVDHLEIRDQSFAGIMAKTDPYCDIPSTREEFTMEDIRIHDNYIHETRGEGIYIGNSFFANGMERDCGQLMPHEIHGVKVYNNIVKNTGWDGIQVGSATQGAEIYNNRVENTGLREIARHGHGIQLGEGTGGKCYNNVVSNVFFNGIQVLGYGDNLIYNNLIVNPGNNGSFIDSRMPATPGPGFNFIHNTIVNPGANGVMIFATDDHLQNKVLNNLIVNTGTYQEYEDNDNWKMGEDSYVLKHSVHISNTAIEGNYGTQDIAEVMFEDALNGDYHLQSTSPAINYGVDISTLGISLDADLGDRLIGDGYDAGAYEYGATPEPAPNQAPVAIAGNDKVISITEVTLDGSSSTDHDGEIVSYQWSKVSGPGTITIVDPAAEMTEVQNLEVGDYVFELSVEDNEGGISSDQVKITVLAEAPANIAPTVNGGDNQAITLPTNTLSITATANDEDGSIQSYSWEKTEGPAVNMTGTATETLSLEALLEGVYIFQITVSDDQGAQASDQVKVTVLPAEPANINPTVSAGSEQSITLPTNTLSITATANDEDGSIQSYSWEKTEGPAVNMTGTATEILSLEALLEGVYIFQITVSDDQGAQASDQVKVTVLPAEPANITPTVSAGSDHALVLPESTLTITADAHDPDGTIESYLWEKTEGSSVDLSGITTNTLSLAKLKKGAYKFRVTVKDNQGAEAFDEVLVTIYAAENKAPTLEVETEHSLTLPDNSLTLIAQASDEEGEIQEYQWEKSEGPAVEMAGITSEKLILNHLQIGSYKFHITVRDNYGAEAREEVRVIVNPNPNQVPIVHAGNDSTVALPVSYVILKGTASDVDGRMVTFKWEKIKGPEVKMTNENKAKLILTNLEPGSYAFRLTATDSEGAYNFDEMTLEVLEASPLATNGPEFDLDFKVYPNPVVKNMHVWVSAPDGNEVEVNVLNISGVVLLEESFLLKNNLIDVNFSDANLAAGLYFLKIRLEGKELGISKFFKID